MIKNIHKEKFFEILNNPSSYSQPSVGGSPQEYLEQLNKICGLNLIWPSEYPKGILNRVQLLEICKDKNVPALVLYAAVMAWGGRGKDSNNYKNSLKKDSVKELIKAIESLRNSNKSRMEDFGIMKEFATKIEGLGISFYTKLLYFIRPNNDAYILDQFTAKSSLIIFNNCDLILNSGYPSHLNTPIQYEKFCDNIENLSKEISNIRKPEVISPSQTEVLMFSYKNGEWRKYLKNIFPKKTKKNTIRKIEDDMMNNEEVMEFIRILKQEHESNSQSLPNETLKVYKNPYRLGYKINNIWWQYSINQSTVVVKIYFYGPENIKKYNLIINKKQIVNHYFGEVIESTGNKAGKSISIQIKVSGGFLNKSDWAKICKNCVESMKILHGEFYSILESL